MAQNTPRPIRLTLDRSDRKLSMRMPVTEPALKRRKPETDSLSSGDSTVLTKPPHFLTAHERSALDEDYKYDEEYRIDVLRPAPDISVVSLDKVVFAVHRSKLEGARRAPRSVCHKDADLSPILQEKIGRLNADGPKRLVLTGERETADDIRFLLNVLYGHPNAKASRENLGQLDKAIELAESWQSHFLAKSLLDSLFRHLRVPGIDLFDIFRIASHRCDWQLCAEAIERSKLEARWDGTGKTLEDAMPMPAYTTASNSLFHVAAMPHSCLEKLSVTVIHALVRAHEQARSMEDMDQYCQVMAQEFLSQIDV